jgi:hypothetical protein
MRNQILIQIPRILNSSSRALILRCERVFGPLDSLYQLKTKNPETMKKTVTTTLSIALLAPTIFTSCDDKESNVRTRKFFQIALRSFQECISPISGARVVLSLTPCRKQRNSIHGKLI